MQRRRIATIARRNVGFFGTFEVFRIFGDFRKLEKRSLRWIRNFRRSSKRGVLHDTFVDESGIE